MRISLLAMAALRRKRCTRKPLYGANDALREERVVTVNRNSVAPRRPKYRGTISNDSLSHGFSQRRVVAP